MRATNLLPLERQEALKKEFWRRLALFYGKIAVVLLVVFGGELIAMDMAFYIERKSLNGGEAFKLELKESRSLEERAREIEGMVVSAERFIVQPPLASDQIGEVLAAVSPEITLTKIDFARDGKRIELAGRATDRNALLAFEASLKKSPRAASVVLPFGSLARARDIDFVITVELL
jgi:hypothetical protein